MSCLKCADTGYDVFGQKCESCDYWHVHKIPILLNIPSQYQGVQFDRSFLPKYLQDGYGSYVESLIPTVVGNINAIRNILICAPPNSGKTIMCYDIMARLFEKGVEIPLLYDLLEVRELFNSFSSDKNLLEQICNSRLVFIKIPYDVPARFGETISTIIDRRVRHNGGTIFIYNGSVEDLKNLDKYDRFTALIGDGSFNTIEVKSWYKPKQSVAE